MADHVFVRVTGKMIRANVNNTVRVVGKLISQTSDRAEIQLSDNETVNVELNPGSEFTTYVEVGGEVQPDGSLKEMWSYNIGPEFDLANYEAGLQAYQKNYPQ